MRGDHIIPCIAPCINRSPPPFPLHPMASALPPPSPPPRQPLVPVISSEDGRWLMTAPLKVGRGDSWGVGSLGGGGGREGRLLEPCNQDKRCSAALGKGCCGLHSQSFRLPLVSLLLGPSIVCAPTPTSAPHPTPGDDEAWGSRCHLEADARRGGV